MNVKVVLRTMAGEDVDLDLFDGELRIEISGGEDLGARQARLIVDTGLNRVEFAGELRLVDVVAGRKARAAVL